MPLSARIGTLSGGQRTRVAFALAFGKRPDLLLLDEPMSDLDPLARHELWALLMAEAAEHGTTVLMSSHMLAEMEDMCDYLLVLAEGRLRMAGETDELVPAHPLVTGRGRGRRRGARGAATPAHRGRSPGHRTAVQRPGPAATARSPTAGRCWSPSLEEVLLAYLRSPEAPTLIADEARVDGPRESAA